MTPNTSINIHVRQVTALSYCDVMGSIANIGNKTSDRGKSLYQIPHPYTTPIQKLMAARYLTMGQCLSYGWEGRQLKLKLCNR